MSGVLLWGWDAVNEAWVKVLVNASGEVITVAAIDHLDDIGDVSVAAPTDQYLLYWDAATSLWKCKALTDSDIPAAICRDSELATHAALTATHGVAGTIASIANIATHAALTATHGVAGTIAGLADIVTYIATHTAIKDAHFSNVITITFIVDGGGAAITTGQKGHLEIPFACTLTAWTLVADVAGAIVIDVWKDTYANFPPTNADAMPGAGKEPTIAATNQQAQDTNISDWASVAIAAGSVLAFNVDSCTTITRVTLSLKATKT